MKKLSLPQPDSSSPESVQRFLQAIKNNVEVITGRRAKIVALAETASQVEIIAKINELLNRLQD